MNDDERPNYHINWDKLMKDIYSYNFNEDRFHTMVNQMCLDIEAIDELVKWMPCYSEADFVIQNVKGNLK